MSNVVFELFAKLGLDSSEYEEGLNNVKSLAGTIGGGIKTAFGIGTKAIGVATAAIGAFGLASVKGYAEYEQLVGGVDKLYGEASGKLQQYANEAYKTAGMSANQYMETATSFSAALVNSLGGDVNKAADMTDVAMRAISDNVNTFGSDMGSVTNAFQGFAKQNYTMLDNLKLGYGGTKSEMERLIADANEYRASIGETSDLSIDSFADVVQAIQSVQEAQNIAGTTSKEAMKTIEGSAAATKAAWQNVITAIAGGGDLDVAFKQLTTSIFGENEGEGFLNQVIPRIQTTMEGIGTFIENAAPYITEKLPALISSILPSVIEGGISLIGAIGEGLINSIPTITNAAVQIVVMLVKGLVEALPQLAQGVVTLITALGQSLYNNGPTLLESGKELVSFVWDGITQGLPQLLTSGAEMVSNIVGGFIEGYPKMIETASNLLTEVLDYFLSNLPQFMQTGADLLMNLLNGFIENLPQVITAVVQMITQFIATIAEHLPEILEQGLLILGQLIAGLIQAIPQLIAAIPQIITSIVDTFGQYDWLSIGVNILEGIKDGILSAVGSAIDAAKEAAGAIWDTITGFFDINSPSKRMAWVGEMLDKGLANGIDAYSGLVDDAIGNVSDIADINAETNINGSGTNGTNMANNVIINVYGAPGQDEEEIAIKVANVLRDKVVSIGAMG